MLKKLSFYEDDLLSFDVQLLSESLCPAASFDLRFNMHLAISHESAKYWLLLCYKCSIHCRATHLHCRKPIFLRKVSLYQSTNTGHMTTQFGLRPFFATNAAKVVVALLFCLHRKKAVSWTKRFSGVFIVVVWLTINRPVLANHPAPILPTILAAVLFFRDRRDMVDILW